MKRAAMRYVCAAAAAQTLRGVSHARAPTRAVTTNVLAGGQRQLRWATDKAVDVRSIASAARSAARDLAALPLEQRNAALLAVADAVMKHRGAIEAANDEDLKAAADPSAGVAPALQARLVFKGSKLETTVTGVRDVARLPDPIGATEIRRELSEGLTMRRVTVPLGVLGIIFEARPDAALQIASLAVKSGNGVLLKCGREAVRTCTAIVAAIREGLRNADVPEEVVALLTTREQTAQMLKLSEYIDLIIPRGSNEFVKYVMSNTDITVLGHADGICHVYVDSDADLAKAVTIAIDSKIQYPAACNALETLLVNKEVAAQFLPRFAEVAAEKQVELRLDAESAKILPGDYPAATEEDWNTEYCDKILAIKVVDSTPQAVDHINTYGSRHTDCIVTENEATARTFQSRVGSAGVYWNASTRFADGFRYGFGAEVGVSTSVMPPRGPVGLEGIVTHKYVIDGDGHTVDEFSSGKRSFTHKDF